ncbi:MAG: hypothetical protein SGPRY_000164 [Prymnesium sp.]
MFQYWYQVNIFKRLFPSVERFTNQSWLAKAKDGPGLLALAGQTFLDLGMLCFVYLPVFYTFKAAKNLQKDAYDGEQPSLEHVPLSFSWRGLSLQLKPISQPAT